MKGRCDNPKNPKYPIYGGRGITYPAHWATFDGFLADMGERPEGHSLDRIDTNKSYSPDNCRWATPKEQSSNLRCNVRYDFEGERLTCPELARRAGVSTSAMAYRIKKWPTNRWMESRHGHKP